VGTNHQADAGEKIRELLGKPEAFEGGKIRIGGGNVFLSAGKKGAKRDTDVLKRAGQNMPAG